MSSSMITKKALTSSAYKIDPNNAERISQTRFNLTPIDMCVDPAQHTFDQYGREADPYSLFGTQGGACSALSPQNNLQAWLVRENNTRSFIHHDLSGGGGYDTMGVGRIRQTTYTGGNQGQGIKGGWNHVNMPKAPMQSASDCGCAPPTHYQMGDANRGNVNLSSAAVSHYSG